MFRSAPFLSSTCLLGTHKSLFGTLDFKKKDFRKAVCNSRFCQPFHMVSSKSGPQRKDRYISEPNSSKCVLQKPHVNLKKTFPCFVNTSCSSNSEDTTDLSLCKINISVHYCSYTTLPDNSILRVCLNNKCPLPENNTGTHRLSVDTWRAKLIRSRNSHRSYHITGSPSNTKSYNLTQGLWSYYHEQWRDHGPVKSQTRGLHRRVPQQAAFEDCLSAKNEERCRRHLQSNTALYEKERGKSLAAVLVCMCTVGGEPALLFTLRSSKLRGRHKGDVSFAGGKQDPSDKNVEETALREAREELGINVTENEVWGVLKPLNDWSGMMIAPVLANLGPLETLSLSPNPSEVEEIFTLTVAHVCNPQNQGYTHFRTGNRYGYTLPIFHSDKYRIWGLTAVALDRTLKLIMPE